MFEWLLIESIGWTADILFLLAYILVAEGKIKGEGKAFNWMNLVGAFFFGAYAFLRKTPPVFVLEIFWAAIAIRALSKIYRPRPAK